MDGGHCYGILIEAKLVEFVVLIGQASRAVAFVDGGNDRLSAPLEHDRNIAVGGGQTGADIAEKDDDVCVLNGDLCLHLHLGQDDVNDDHLSAAPLGLAVDAVACDARRILNNGAPLAYELVEQRGLAHIGASHDGNNRF